jgi:hypothetical protein
MDNKDSSKSNIYKKLTVALSVALVICIVFILSVLYGKDELFAPAAVVTIPAAVSALPSSFMLTGDDFIAAMIANSGVEHELYTYNEKTVSGDTVKISIASDTTLNTKDTLTVVGKLTLKNDVSGYVIDAQLELQVISKYSDIIPDSAIASSNIAIAQAFLLAADSKAEMLSAGEYNDILGTIAQYDTYPSVLRNKYGAYDVTIYPPSVNQDQRTFILDIGFEQI